MEQKITTLPCILLNNNSQNGNIKRNKIKEKENEENVGILNHRQQNSLFPITSLVRMVLLHGKRVSAVILTMVICESATHEWKIFLFYEVSKYNAVLFWNKLRCNLYTKVSFHALCKVKRCNFDNSLKIRIKDTVGRTKATFKNIIYGMLLKERVRRFSVEVKRT